LEKRSFTGDISTGEEFNQTPHSITKLRNLATEKKKGVVVRDTSPPREDKKIVSDCASKSIYVEHVQDIYWK
jgi:hypothetical protein